VQSVHAFIAGEHGDSEFPLWSSATIGSVPVDDFCLAGRRPLDDEAKQRIATEVVTAAEQIIRWLYRVRASSGLGEQATLSRGWGKS